MKNTRCSPPPVVLPFAGQAIAILSMAGLARSSRTAKHLHRSTTATTGCAHGGSADINPSSIVSSSLGLTLTLALYHILHVLVPSSWILLGSYHLDLLHGIYLIVVLLYCGGTAVRLAPDPWVGVILPDFRENHDICDFVEDVEDGAAAANDEVTARSSRLLPSRPPLPLPSTPPSHRLLRLYASMHLLALYVAMCGELPGLRVLQPVAWATTLRLVGLWEPNRTADCLPLLGALVLATAHAVLGKVLRAAGSDCGAGGGRLRMTQHPAAAPAAVQGWLLAVGTSLCSIVSSIGYLLLAALLYVLVLYDMRIGLLGLGYLMLGLPLLLAPPRRGKYVALLRLSQQRYMCHVRHGVSAWESYGGDDG